MQCFLRQIEPADGGILVEVAQDVGELQRAAEVMRQRQPVIPLHAEHTDAQPADRARDPVAIEVERREVRRADGSRDVHLHAVDHGEKVLALQIEGAHRLRQPAQVGWRVAGIDRVDVVAPALQPFKSLGAYRRASSAMSSTARQNE